MHLMKLIQQGVIAASLLLLTVQVFRGSSYSNSHVNYDDGNQKLSALAGALSRNGGGERLTLDSFNDARDSFDDEDVSFDREEDTEGNMVAGEDITWDGVRDDQTSGSTSKRGKSKTLTFASPSEPSDGLGSDNMDVVSGSDAEGLGSLEMLENMDVMRAEGGNGPPSEASCITMNKYSLPPEGDLILTPWEDKKKHTVRTLGPVTRELLRVLPERDVLGGKHFNTCAVVGSAGLLLEDEFGASIDGHDMVMRFNIAPTKGYEKHVGRKTTLRLVNRKHFGFRETETEIVLQHLTLAELVPEFIKLRQANPRAPTYAIDMCFYDRVLEEEHQFPTNGYLGIHMALMLCRKIDIYGFLRDWKGWVPYHYFNAEEPNDRQTPRDNREQSMIELLLSMHSDRLRMMHPCVFDDTCAGCSRGALCNGKKPFPIPRLGYCRLPNTSCFFMCKPGIYICGKGHKGECVPKLHKSQCIPPHGLDGMPRG